MPENLKPCPACDSSSVSLGVSSGWVMCDNPNCLLDGPHGDSDGAKWNALPRRTDASQGMDDCELLTRAIVNGFATIAATLAALQGQDMLNGLGDGPQQFAKAIMAELDRRAAASKESK